MKLITYEEILRAREVVSRYLPSTPLYPYRGLSEVLGCEAFVKHENHLPTGAFKVRGGVYLMANLSAEERGRGVIVATRGNHGLSIAFAARLFGVKATVVVPEGNNPEKNAAMVHLGARLIVHGRDYDEARGQAEDLTRKEGYRYIHAANEPDLIRGVGTYAVEILEALPEVEVIIVPVGLGSGACGAAIVCAARSPKTRIIGVQAEGAPAVYLSWKEGRRVETATADTMADGLATRVPADLTLGILRRHLREMVLVSEEEIRGAIRLLLRETHNLVEGAGAAPAAAARKLRDELRGKRTVLVMTGGNLDSATLLDVLSE